MFLFENKLLICLLIHYLMSLFTCLTDFFIRFLLEIKLSKQLFIFNQQTHQQILHTLKSISTINPQIYHRRYIYDPQSFNIPISFHRLAIQHSIQPTGRKYLLGTILSSPAPFVMRPNHCECYTKTRIFPPQLRQTVLYVSGKDSPPSSLFPFFPPSPILFGDEASSPHFPLLDGSRFLWLLLLILFFPHFFLVSPGRGIL